MDITRTYEVRHRARHQRRAAKSGVAVVAADVQRPAVVLPHDAARQVAQALVEHPVLAQLHAAPVPRPAGGGREGGREEAAVGGGGLPPTSPPHLPPPPSP